MTQSPQEQVGFDVFAFPGGARAALEAVLMVIDEPVSTMSLASALELPVDDVDALLRELAADYTGEQRGFALRQVGGGWRIYSRSDYAQVVERFLLDGQHARLTQAALETLAVIAYKQPVTRSRIGAIRGVNVESVVRTLLARGLICEIDDSGDGGAIRYGTTTYFLERMGLQSLDELPALAPYLPDSDLLDDLVEQGRS